MPYRSPYPQLYWLGNGGTLSTWQVEIHEVTSAEQTAPCSDALTS